MKHRQPHYRESNEEAIIRRREAIVDRALLYAHLLSIIDERSKEDDGDETVVAETDQGVSQEKCEEQQCSTDPATKRLHMLASDISATN